MAVTLWMVCFSTFIENEIPIHRQEYNGAVYHSYQRGDSDDDDDGSFISIPDESHTPFNHYTTRSPQQKHSKHKRNKNKTKTGGKHKTEIYELTEHATPDIAYHNDAYVSDVEVELDVEFTPSPYRIGSGLIKKTRSMTSKAQGAYQNQAYHDDDERDNCEQTHL